MEKQLSEVLYYPNFDPSDLAGIKQSLLLYDKVNLISPGSTPLMGRVLANSSGEELSQISGSGALNESYALYSAKDKMLNLIPDGKIASSRWDEFQAALAEDLADEEVLAWERRWKARNAGKEMSWYVLDSYFGGNVPQTGSPQHQIEEVYNPSLRCVLFRVPFLVGMSFGLSEALWAAVDHGFTLFTDDNASQDFLMLRLKRGWRRLSRDPELQKAFTVEPEFAAKIAVANLGAWILQSKVPDAIKKASDLSIPEIINLREKSDKKDALERFRGGLANLVQSHDLWEQAKFVDFQDGAYKIYSQEILPAFEELEDRRVHLKEVFKALDVNDALSEGIKAIPELFVGAGVPVALGSAAALLAHHAVAPGALLALGCGVAAHTVPKLISELGGRLKRRRSAQFLAYPLHLKDALSQSS
jgi:hypothetical protein